MRYHHHAVDDDYVPNIATDIEYERCKEMWAAVMKLGVIDAANEFPDGGPATRWMRSDVLFAGSFAWLCQLFDFDADVVRSQARMNFRQIRRTRVPAVTT